METVLWIMSGAALFFAIVAVYLFFAFAALLREKNEEIKHLTNRVDGLMECVREFNKRLNDCGIR
jgi:membrane protein implicated in regulation of membrane protease activity